MTHPFDADSPILTCERDHIRHAARALRVNLADGHGYHDYPRIPQRLHRSFTIYHHDWAAYRNGAGYCPGADGVSEAVATQGCWEPIESALILDALRPGDRFYDFGSQIGWFTCLAAASGANVTAIDCDPVMASLLARTVSLNGFSTRIFRHRIGPETSPLRPTPIRVAKIDLEGWDAHAIRVLSGCLQAGLVDHLLLEVSPCFGPGYPELLDQIISYGYTVRPVPVKGQLMGFEEPLKQMQDIPAVDGTWVPTIHQADVWVSR